MECCLICQTSRGETPTLWHHAASAETRRYAFTETEHPPAMPRRSYASSRHDDPAHPSRNDVVPKYPPIMLRSKTKDVQPQMQIIAMRRRCRNRQRGDR